MTRGLLDGLNDPELMAQVAERSRIVGRLAEQMGVTKEEARRALFDFEAVTSSDGQTLH
jgi:hypothetical protein